MWPFDRPENRVNAERPLLLVKIGDEICAIHPAELPIEKCPVVELKTRSQSLDFVDDHRRAHSYSLETIFDEGVRLLYLSVRVSAAFAVQADCLPVPDDCRMDPRQAFSQRAINGVRLQPFYLPQCKSDPAELAGRGLFVRGMHFPGIITPGNVSLLCICDHCRMGFRLQSFHAGFGNEVYFYCSRGIHTLVADHGLTDAPPLLTPAEPEALRRFENRLPACAACGGAFRYLNPLRCPHCAKPYIDFERFPGERHKEYYGNFLYGGSTQKWRPEAAHAT